LFVYGFFLVIRTLITPTTAGGVEVLLGILIIPVPLIAVGGLFLRKYDKGKKKSGS